MSLDRARFDRRTVLAAALATGGGAVLAAASRGQGAGAAMAQYAARTKPAGSDLGAIEHVVFLMQENRSFDHYYGTYPGVRGFDDHPKDKLGNFAQAWPGGRDKTLLPFHLDTASGIGECTNDLDHSWPAEHSSWNKGTNNAFVSTHVRVGATRGPSTASSPWATTAGRTFPSTTRWPTPSPCATTTTARSWGRRTPTASWRSRAPSSPPARPEGPSSSPTIRPRPSGACTGTPCPRCWRTPG